MRGPHAPSAGGYTAFEHPQTKKPTGTKEKDRAHEKKRQEQPFQKKKTKYTPPTPHRRGNTDQGPKVAAMALNGKKKMTSQPRGGPPKGTEAGNQGRPRRKNRSVTALGGEGKMWVNDPNPIMIEQKPGGRKGRQST